MELDGRVALITGGASGLGRATAEGFARAGARVLVCDLPRSDGPAVAGSLGQQGAFAATDVTREADVAAAVDTAVADLGGLDIVVNCAGVATSGRAVGRRGPLPLEAFTRAVEVNLVGTFNVVRLAVARMAENEPVADERGVVVNTASVAAFDGQIGQVAYSASKGGVAAMTLPLAREFADRQIRVVAIAPGIFETPMMSGLPEAAQESLQAQTLHPRRLGRPGEYAALARHVVENPMLNGEVIRLDGALRMPPR